MKRIFALIMAAMMLLTLAACQPSTPETNDPANSTPSTPSTPVTQPTEPTEDIVVNPTTKPTEPAQPTELADSGYLAVGIVDATAGTAKVVGDNGVIAEIKYVSAEAPVPGKIYSYAKNGDVYELNKAPFINGDYSAWGVRIFDQVDYGFDCLYTHDGVNETIYEMASEVTVFIRFSNTEWRIMKGSDVIKYSGFPCGAYFDVKPNPNGGNQLVSVMLICSVNLDTWVEGNADEANSYFFDKDGFGWGDGDLIIQ